MGINRPPGYTHPKRGDQKPVAEPATTAAIRRFASPVKKKPQGRKPDKASLCEKVVFRVGAYVPVKGEIELFDAMKQDGVSDKDCILALLRKGRTELTTLTSMSRKSIGRLTYEHGGVAFETNRSIPADQADLLRSVIDPHGVLTPRAFGLKIGAALLVLAAREKDNG